MSNVTSVHPAVYDQSISALLSVQETQHELKPHHPATRKKPFHSSNSSSSSKNNNNGIRAKHVYASSGSSSGRNPSHNQSLSPSWEQKDDDEEEQDEEEQDEEEQDDLLDSQPAVTTPNRFVRSLSRTLSSTASSSNVSTPRHRVESNSSSNTGSGGGGGGSGPPELPFADRILHLTESAHSTQLLQDAFVEWDTLHARQLNRLEVSQLVRALIEREEWDETDVTAVAEVLLGSRAQWDQLEEEEEPSISMSRFTDQFGKVAQYYFEHQLSTRASNSGSSSTAQQDQHLQRWLAVQEQRRAVRIAVWHQRVKSAVGRQQAADNYRAVTRVRLEQEASSNAEPTFALESGAIEQLLNKYGSPRRASKDRLKNFKPAEETGSSSSSSSSSSETGSSASQQQPVNAASSPSTPSKLPHAAASSPKRTVPYALPHFS